MMLRRKRRAMMRMQFERSSKTRFWRFYKRSQGAASWNMEGPDGRHNQESNLWCRAWPTRGAPVTRVGGDSDSDESSSDDDDKDRERERLLAEGCARIVWSDSHESVEKVTDIQVLDRAFMNSDVVALALDPLGQTGTIVEVDMLVDLELNGKEIAHGLDSRRL